MTLRLGLVLGPYLGKSSRQRPVSKIKIVLSADNVDIPGTLSANMVTVTGSAYAGTYPLDPAALAQGPVCLVPAVLSSARTGQALSVMPGLWAGDDALGAIRVTRHWLVDGAILDGQTGLDLAFRTDLETRPIVHAETARQPGHETVMRSVAVSWPSSIPEEPVDPQPLPEPQALRGWMVTADQRIIPNEPLPASGRVRFVIDRPASYQGSYVLDVVDLAAGPVCLVPPVLAGAAEDGATLTVTPGLWVSSFQTVTRIGEWFRDDVAVPQAANSDTYSVTATQDAGRSLTYRETVTDAVGSRRSASAALAVAGVKIDSVVVIGASLMEAMFGKSLTTPHAGATSLMAAAGHDLPVYGWATGNARISAAASHYTAARTAFPNALIVMHFGGNDITVGKPYPGEAAAISSGLAALRSAAGDDPRLYPASLSFRDYDDLTFQNPARGSKPYNQDLILPWILAHYPHAMAPSGRPKLDFYCKTLEQHDVWLHADNIHLTDAGYSAFRDWIVAQVADLLEGVVPAGITERVYVAPPSVAPSITAQPTISGSALPGSQLTLTPGSASGTPAPSRTIQWRLNGVDQAGQTGLTYTRPATQGAVPGAVVTWSNGTAPDATATATAAATDQAPAVSVYPDMTLAGGIAAYGPGKFGQAMNCADGFSARASRPLTPVGTVWGVETWLKMPVAARSAIAWGEAGNDRAYLLVRTGGNSPAGQACITYQVGAAQVHLTGGPRIDDDQWHHVAVQFRSTGADLFVDGTCVASNATPVGAAQSGMPWTVGMFASRGDFQWTGQITEMLIWNGIRYDADFTPRTTAHDSLPVGTTAYWALNGTLLGGIRS